MTWDYNLPEKSGVYIVVTTTFMGKHNVLKSRFNREKKTWGFTNQSFYKYLKDGRI